MTFSYQNCSTPLLRKLWFNRCVLFLVFETQRGQVIRFVATSLAALMHPALIYHTRMRYIVSVRRSLPSSTFRSAFASIDAG